MFCLLKRFATKMQPRSHTNFNGNSHDEGMAETVIWSVCLSRTSIFAFTPFFFSASIRRFAAIAAPPTRSDVLMISTRISFQIRAQSYKKKFRV